MYIKEGEEYFYFAGGSYWREMLQQNKLKDEEEKREVKKNGFMWMKDLFGVFKSEKNNSKSRRLASCWYYTASEINFDEEEDEEESEGALQESMQNQLDIFKQMGLFGTDQILSDQEEVEDEEEEAEDEEGEEKKVNIDQMMENYNSEEDDDFFPDNEEDSIQSDREDSPRKRKLQNNSAKKIIEDIQEGKEEKEEKIDDGKEEIDEGKEDIEEEKEDTPKKRRLENLELENYNSEEDQDFQPEDEDEDEEYQGDDEINNLPQDKIDSFNLLSNLFSFNESQVNKDTREYILDCIDELNAYMPSPSSHPPFFKRMLVKMNSNAPENLKWFPYGLPLQKMVSTIQEDDDEDEEMCTFLREVLTPFASLQRGEGELEDEDDEEDYEEN